MNGIKYNEFTVKRLPRKLKKNLKKKFKHRYSRKWHKCDNLIIEYYWFYRNPLGWDMNKVLINN